MYKIWEPLSTSFAFCKETWYLELNAMGQDTSVRWQGTVPISCPIIILPSQIAFFHRPIHLLQLPGTGHPEEMLLASPKYHVY